MNGKRLSVCRETKPETIAERKKNISPCQEILSIFRDAATMKCGSFKDHKAIFFLKKTSFFENQFLDQTTFWGK